MAPGGKAHDAKTLDPTLHAAINSMLYAAALQKCDVPYELHIFPHGQHGKGLALDDDSVGQWRRLFENWLKTLSADRRPRPSGRTALPPDVPRQKSP